MNNEPNRDGLFIPFDWLNSMSRLGYEITAKVIQATADIARGYEVSEDLTPEIVTMAEILARDCEILKRSNTKEAERKREARAKAKAKKEKEMSSDSPDASADTSDTSSDKSAQSGRIRVIDIDRDVDVDGDVDVESQHNNPSDYHVCVSNAHTQLNADEINRLVEAGVPMRYIEYFESRVKAGKYKCNDPASTCMSWWLKDKNKEEWKSNDGKLASSFETYQFFDDAVKRSME